MSYTGCARDVFNVLFITLRVVLCVYIAGMPTCVYTATFIICMRTVCLPLCRTQRRCPEEFGIPEAAPPDVHVRVRGYILKIQSKSF